MLHTIYLFKLGLSSAPVHSTRVGLVKKRKMEFGWISRAIIVFCMLVPTVLGWGIDGHYATCKIAQSYLTKDALAAIKELLPEHAEGDLANVCAWPDEIRHQYPWSSALHFADTPAFRCNYQYSRDCHDSVGLKDRCVTGAIYNYTMQLLSERHEQDLSLPKNNLTEALIFLSHFVGDVHQPLHVGFTEDLGGNSILVQWFGTKTTLHHVWDDMIIESALKTFYDQDLKTMIRSIQSNITDSFVKISSQKNCNGTVCPEPYASESINLACKYAYSNVTQFATLGDDYFLPRLPIVEKRLAQGGVRLAAILNSIFSVQRSLAEE